MLLAALGFAGGFFIVPIAALLQHRPDKDKKGEVLATANLLSFVGIFLASGAHFLLAQVAHLTPGQIFLFGGVLTLAGAVYALFLLPDALLRFVLWCSRGRFTGFASRAATTSPPRAARCLSAITFRLWTPCCCSLPPTGRCGS